MSQIREFESSPFNPWRQIEALLSEKHVKFELTTVRDAYDVLASLKGRDVAIVEYTRVVDLDSEGVHSLPFSLDPPSPVL